jgi:hypothetical protein
VVCKVKSWPLHLVKGVDSFSLLHAIAAGVAVAGVEVVPCDVADGGVFGLNPVAEGYRVTGDVASEIARLQLLWCQWGVGKSSCTASEADTLAARICAESKAIQPVRVERGRVC